MAMDRSAHGHRSLQDASPSISSLDAELTARSVRCLSGSKFVSTNQGQGHIDQADSGSPSTRQLGTTFF
jgi:hypothetical protein